MSHITTIDLMITDLDSLAQACERLGLELVRGQKTFRGYTTGHCDHVVKAKFIAGAYEIGLTKRSDGKGYDLKWDGGMSAYGPAKLLYDKVGYDEITYDGKSPSMDKLKDWYAAEVAKKQMRRQGFRVTATQQQGRVQVVCSK